jgi:1,4-alpha-glucan branching enzyme
MTDASLALVLHAHLPFVRHPEHEDFLEEDWLFEAITEAYIPLLITLQRLGHDGVAFKLTLSLTPTLCSMLGDPLLRARYLRYLDRAIGLARQEIERNREEEPLRDLSQFYFDTFTECRRRFVEEWECDLVGAFRRLQDTGAIEIIASAATHGFLPLLQQSPEALRAQVLIGRDQYRETFGCEPRGFWLPECGYTPALDQILQEANIRWFIIDAHGLLFGNPRPRRAVYAPCYTPAGPAAFARDRESSRQVWSAQEGYPGDPAYRDFYRDAGYDLPLDYLREFLPSPPMHKFTGLKYHRITGAGPNKEIYRRTWAENVVQAHATHFLEGRQKQLAELATLDFDPIVVVPFDAELFGHWWFEGPRFLDLFIRKAIYDQANFQLTTPSQYLGQHPTQQIVAPAASSWGEGGHSEMWLDPANSWVYPHLDAAARRMTELARAHANQTTRLAERVLKQLALELLLAQSSDWTFLMKTGTAREYATKRLNDHLMRFNRLHQEMVTEKMDEAFLYDCEQRDNLFSNVNWRYYL